MTKGRDKTDIVAGVLRGHDFKCYCTVAIMTKLTPGKTGNANAVETSLKITSAEATPPDGTYDLDILGRIFKIRRQGGKWPTLPL